MNKFKTGDKIRRKENMRDFGNWPKWCGYSCRTSGDVFEVERYDEYSFLCLKDMPGHWDDENFELVEEEPAQNPNADKEQIPFERLNFYKPYRMVADERCPKCKGKGFTKRYQLLEILGDLPEPCKCLYKDQKPIKCKEYPNKFLVISGTSEGADFMVGDRVIASLTRIQFNDWYKSLPEVEEK